MSSTCLRVEMRDGVMHLTKTNPESGYGISLAMLSALENAFEQEVLRPDIRAIVMDAEGSGFHRGAVMVSEIREHVEELTRKDFREIVQRGQALGRRIAATPKPVIGIAQAGALGGGLELLLRCDFVFALESAEFSFPEVTLGLVAAWGGTQWGGRMAPFRRAQEILLLGEVFSGSEAARMGLITHAFADQDGLDKHLRSVLERLKYCSAASLARTKACLAATWQGPLEYGERVEVDSEVAAMDGGDFVKAYAARRNDQVYNFYAGNAEPREQRPSTRLTEPRSRPASQ
jgi:enoyl-CoA hydratase/carnithine racemase